MPACGKKTFSGCEIVTSRPSIERTSWLARDGDMPGI